LQPVCPDRGFHAFPQSIQGTAGIVPWPLPSKSYAVTHEDKTQEYICISATDENSSGVHNLGNMCTGICNCGKSFLMS
jgi:hypothetical protein